MGPQNAIIGNDANYGTDIPETRPPQVDLSSERNAARFSRTKEFEALKERIQVRQAYHRRFSPGSQGETAFRDMPNEERGWRSLAADLVIEELQMIIDAYEMAAEEVRNAEKAERARRQSA